MIHHFLCQCKEFTPLKWSCVKFLLFWSGQPRNPVPCICLISLWTWLNFATSLGGKSEMWKPGFRTTWLMEEGPAQCHLGCPGEQDRVCVPGRPGHLSVSSGKKEEEEVVRKANFWVRIFHWNLGLLAYLWQVISLCLWTPVVSVIKWSSLLQQWLCGSTETVALLLNCRGPRSIHWYSLERVSNFS